MIPLYHCKRQRNHRVLKKLAKSPSISLSLDTRLTVSKLHQRRLQLSIDTNLPISEFQVNFNVGMIEKTTRSHYPFTMNIALCCQDNMNLSTINQVFSGLWTFQRSVSSNVYDKAGRNSYPTSGFKRMPGSWFSSPLESIWLSVGSCYGGWGEDGCGERWPELENLAKYATGPGSVIPWSHYCLRPLCEYRTWLVTRWS